MARERISDGSVFVDGRRVLVQSRPVREGERVEVREPPRAPSHPVGEPAMRAPGQGRQATARVATPCPPFARDGGLLVANKPSGMPTEPTRQASRGTLTFALREQLTQADGKAPAFLAAVHRLDRETSGLVLVATRREDATALGAQFQEGRVERVYLALVDGAPAFESERFDAPLARDRGPDGRYALTPHGRPALTLVRVRARTDQTALLEVEPRTGRTHQIRAHLAAAGHPIVGDVRYGGSAAWPGAFGLHALTLSVEREGARAIYAAAPPAAFYDLAAARGLDEREIDAMVQTRLEGARCVVRSATSGRAEK